MRVCAAPGCPSLTKSTYCPAHDMDRERRRLADMNKGAGRQFYSSPAWRKVRSLILMRDPRCTCEAQCGQRSDTVDHIIPRRDRPDLALDPSNLRGMYSRCHNRHTAQHGGGFGNRKTA